MLCVVLWAVVCCCVLYCVLGVGCWVLGCVGLCWGGGVVLCVVCWNVLCSSFIQLHSPFIHSFSHSFIHPFIHQLPFAIHHPSIIYRSSIIHFPSSFVIHHLSFFMHHSSFVYHHSSFIINCSSSLVHHSSFIIRSAFIIRFYSPFLIHHSSFIIHSPFIHHSPFSHHSFIIHSSSFMCCGLFVICVKGRGGGGASLDKLRAAGASLDHPSCFSSLWLRTLLSCSYGFMRSVFVFLFLLGCWRLAIGVSFLFVGILMFGCRFDMFRRVAFSRFTFFDVEC